MKNFNRSIESLVGRGRFSGRTALFNVVIQFAEENSTFFVTVDIGSSEKMELVFRVDDEFVSMVRARLITPKKVVLCDSPYAVLEAMDNGTSFSEAGCDKHKALKEFFS